MSDDEPIPEGQVRVGVIRDGVSSWICEVEWPDGVKVHRATEFHVAGTPLVITTEEKALECLEAWVRDRPQDWRRP